MTQRTLKFRAWDRVGKRLYQVDELLNLWSQYDSDSELRTVPHIRAVKQSYRGRDFDPIVGKDCDLMQNTGLHDKNGKEIYEGDIYITPLLGKNSPMVVEWKRCGFSPLENEELIEVIGNIWENKELLNEPTT